ncbi:hypothetical protein [Fundidesulfovibrio agrisoli]|uniref:hypothetical protein n=1 Tax=Fundidesulfovibrio agrisoli TaxID=2922717 RepID=UPI001FAE49D0|nr:hypothetical protein [Fundidesulfovibrio agrisoli]
MSAYTRIDVPRDGMLTNRYANLGAFVNAGQQGGMYGRVFLPARASKKLLLLVECLRMRVDLPAVLTVRGGRPVYLGDKYTFKCSIGEYVCEAIATP